MKDQIAQINNGSKDLEFGARIKVVGIGGSGGNAIDYMINSGVSGVDFIAVNCDVQDLFYNKAEKKIHIGKNLTKGLGAGMNPEIGRRAAEETKNELQDALKGADLVFITCGLGGGTGTGASPIIAEVARNQGSLTLGVVTRPFSFEGAERARIAKEGLKNLTEMVDTVIVIPNDRLLEVAGEKTTLSQAFALCDDVLKNAVQGIAELIIKPGIINVDFADVKTIMTEAGPAIMGIGTANGENRAVEAAKKAISSRLLDISIDGARGILFVVAGGDDLMLSEINEAAKVITASTDPKAKIIFGAIRDEELNKGMIKITVIAGGFTNQGSKIITKERRNTDDTQGEVELLAEKEEEDRSIPAFLRRGKPSVPQKLIPREMKKERRVDQTSLHVLADIVAKPQPRVSPRNYSGIDNPQLTRSTDLWDFNIEEKIENPIRNAKEGFWRNPEVSFRSLAKKIGDVLFILFALIVAGIMALAVGIYALIKFLKSRIARIIWGRQYLIF